jgi:hypothetical protein
LGDAAIKFREFDYKEENLRLRTKKQRELDRKLMKAKDYLTNFVNKLEDDQIMPMDYLLQ